LEALAASGIRSMRYALEIENINEIVANDFDQKAVELIDVNIKLNSVEHIVKSNYDDAVSLMYARSKNKKTHFDCIDLGIVKKWHMILLL
jgi:tRNA (guanine26-N2/guanine27-N2)-dimethyltransferase